MKDCCGGLEACDDDDEDDGGGILVWVWPSWVWTLKNVFGKFCVGLVVGGRKTEVESSWSSSVRNTDKGGLTGSLKGGDGMNLSSSSLTGAGAGLVGSGGP